MDFLELASKRYSCKQYSDRPVEEEKMKLILESGRAAPTAKNLQEQHIYIARSAATLAKIDECTHCRYGAPIVLIVAFDKDNVYTYPGGKRQSGIEDASIVATHLMLAAASVGVDSCWINCFDPDKMHHLLGLPENEEILMLLDLGYAAEGAGPLPNHSLRKPLAETVTVL
ncbi:MAG: nitroreductase family protein [Clostridiales bacterium]|nr:nitroreductase family protein [Clostridiales bacterium]